MAAFFVWLEFSQKPIDQRVAGNMLQSIRSYGGDHEDLQISGNVAIGVSARWQTQEDVGETQPIYGSGQQQCVLFEGRIDNRAHLLQELNQQSDLNSELDSKLSDAELVLRFLTRFGDSRMAEVIGPFALVWLNLAKGELRAYRDTLGGRYLCFFHSSDRLIIASTEEAFMPHPDVGHRVRAGKISAWLSGCMDAHRQSCLEQLSLLDPGQRLIWQKDSPAEIKTATFYRPNPNRRLMLGSDQAYAEEFRKLLDQAVHRRLRVRTSAKVGVLLSGGLDSAPITVSAAQATDRAITAFSWVFNDSPQMDERQYSTPLCERLGVQQKLIACDDLWPKFDADTHNNPLFPIALPYSEFQQQTFRQANAEGVTVLLSGLQGDLLYETSNRQVLESIARGHWRAALNEFMRVRRSQKLSVLQTFKRYVLAPHRRLSKLIDRRQRSMSSPPWLSDWARAALKQSSHWLAQDSSAALRPSQYQIVLDGFAGEDAMLGRCMENKYRVERRYPFRDRDLCEFMLSIPTAQLEHLGLKRPIVKRAYAAEFDEVLASRNDKTEFSGALLNGINKDLAWRAELTKEPQYWRKFVKICNISDQNQSNLTEMVVLWRCAYYNFWHRLWYDSQHNNES